MNYRLAVLNHVAIGRIAMIDLLLLPLRYFLFSSILILALRSLSLSPSVSIDQAFSIDRCGRSIDRYSSIQISLVCACFSFSQEL